MSSTLTGIVSSVKAVQPRKASLRMDLHPGAMVTFSRATQFSKVYGWITFSVEGRVTDRSWRQSENARVPMVSTPSGICSSVRAVQLEKA